MYDSLSETRAVWIVFRKVLSSHANDYLVITADDYRAFGGGNVSRARTGRVYRRAGILISRALSSRRKLTKIDDRTLLFFYRTPR